MRGVSRWSWDPWLHSKFSPAQGFQPRPQSPLEMLFAIVAFLPFRRQVSCICLCQLWKAELDPEAESIFSRGGIGCGREAYSGPPRGKEDGSGLNGLSSSRVKLGVERGIVKNAPETIWAQNDVVVSQTIKGVK